MESDVNATLSDLERKLKELERELEAVGRGGETDAEPAQAGWAPPPPPGTTPLVASWHGGQGASPPPAPPPAFNGAPPAVPVQRPEAPIAEPPAARVPATASLHSQLDELLAFRERLVRSTNDLVDELSRVLADLGAEVPAAAEPAPPPPPPDPAETVLAGHVVLEVGPFAHVGTLAAFEQALAATRGVAGVHVRALNSGHATIDVDLAEPVALAAELRATTPVAVTVTDVGEGRLALAVTGSGGAPAA
jgi:hypothetical protein